MSAQLTRNIFPRTLLVYTIMVSVCGILFAPGSKAQTTWTITVDATKGNDPPEYKIDPPADSPKKNCAGANPNPKPSADYLYICRGDNVQWNLITTGGQGLLTIHQSEGFHHGASSPVQWYRAVERTKLAYLTTAKTDPIFTYKYCVALYDNNGSLYSHDPKIIIGGTNVEAEIEQFKNVYVQLLNAIADDADADKKAKEQARKQATRINDQIQKLLRLLKK
jgi:hypothetical protein